MIYVSYIANGSLFVMPYLMTKLAEKFSKENLHIQKEIIPRWKLTVRERFDYFVPPDAFYKRYVTVILPENLLFGLYLSYCMIPDSIPFWKTTVLIFYCIEAFIVIPLGIDELKKFIAWSHRDLIPDYIINSFKPRDYVLRAMHPMSQRLYDKLTCRS